MRLRDQPVRWSQAFRNDRGRWTKDYDLNHVKKGTFLGWKNWFNMKVAMVDYQGKKFHVLPENLTFLNLGESKKFENEIVDKRQVMWQASYKKGRGIFNLGPAGIGYFQEWTTIDSKKVARVKGLNGREIFVEPERLKFICGPR